MSAKIEFRFFPFPLMIVDDGVALSLGEYRLLGYLLRHQFRIQSDTMKLTQDELLHGLFAPNGERRDGGCLITSGRDLKMARTLLERHGLIKVRKTPNGTVYKLCLTDNDRIQNAPEGAKYTADPDAECTYDVSANCSLSKCKLSTLPVQNALEVIRSKKVKKIEEEQSLVLTAAAVQHGPYLRHAVCKAICEEYATHKGVAFAWDGSEGRGLDLLLKAAPTLTVELFRECVRNRALSEVSHGERPRMWLATVLKYQGGPLDRFGVPKGDSDATSRESSTGGRSDGNKAQRRTNRNIEAARRARG